MVISISLFQIISLFGVRSTLLAPAAVLDGILMPLRTVNSYGLFAVMTTERREIIVEGSNDGVTWLPYEFKYKPGDVNRRPGFVEPFQPRLDWQMWFAALGDVRQNPWFEQILRTAVARFAGSSEAAGEESISRQTAEVYPRGILRLSLHRCRRTPRNRRLVAAQIDW